ncbi:MAG: hypothetical protein PHQ98_03510 [Candidatus ainarchaeum sp.]|nr:hypothetical protein [Candidatus ainarchaeum sp.]
MQIKKIPKLRPIRTPIHFSKIFELEGIKSRESKSKPNISELHDASIFLFKQIMPPDDVRWRLATEYATLKKEFHISPINLENGMRAKYGSKSQGSNKERGASITGVLHVRQLARALKNIELGHKFLNTREPIRLYDSKYSIKFENTKSIEKKHDSRGVSGCPEALWQLQLYESNKYLGRIGFNFHMEGEKVIVTVSNVQGAEHSKQRLDSFKLEFKSNFGNFLITKLQQMLGPNFVYRGVVPSEINQTQYRMSFRKSNPKLRVWSLKNKAQVDDFRTKLIN